ncbi:MAG: T9SS type A sorting domain-containing protein [Flavobacteriaceae bacterium]
MGDKNFNFHLFGETGKITTYKKLYTTFFAILCFAISSTTLYAQTIPSTGSEVTTCGNCTPTGWTDDGGTPDVSDRNAAGGQGSAGASAPWINAPLPIPPTGDLTWITMKDLGSSGIAEESVKTTMGGIVNGDVYVLTIYTLTAVSTENGTSNWYSGTAKTQYRYRISQTGGTPGIDQTVTGVTEDVWTKTRIYFIGDPDGSGNMDLNVFPGTFSAYTGAGGTTRVNIESLHLAVELNALKELDTDGDGVPDTVDIDDDNDGILDTEEVTNPLGDADGDKLPNYLDPDYSTTTGNGGIPDEFDFDDDGIANHLDLDADGDGIPDNIEAQSTLTGVYIAPAADVPATYTANNGLNSAYVGQAFISNPQNTDGAGDGADYLDLNSDNDATSDTIEANLILSGNILDNGLDDSYDNGDDYTDVNGIFDNTQDDNFPNTGPGADVNWRDSGIDGTLDTDGDGVANSVDVDDDNDGILDILEECATITTNTGVNSVVSTTGSVSTPDEILTAPNPADVGDGARLNNISESMILELLPSAAVVPAGTTITVTTTVNNTGVKRMLYQESNIDGTTLGNELYHVAYALPSATPGTSGSSLTAIEEDITGNTNNSTVYRYSFVTQAATSYLLVDMIERGNGRINIDYVEIQSYGSGCTTNLDSDNDGIPNYLDLDSDNDGIPDNIEAQSTTGYIAPSGAPGAGFTDADGDGLDDNYDPIISGTTTEGVFINPPNTDSGNDAIADYLDSDSDNDGASDRTEAGLSLSGSVGINGLDDSYDNGDNYTDVNGNYDDTQSDNFPDADADVLTTGDVDYRDTDSVYRDNDGDGIVDSVDLDDDNDGILDTDEDENTDMDNDPSTNPTDTDGDGIPDYFDLDSDNDGIPDNIEAQPTTGYDVPDGVYGLDGVDTAYTGGLSSIEDTDNDGTPDYKDTDSDNDGILDNTEAGLTLTGVYGNNGLDNAYDNGDSYTDVNGSFDNSQTDNFPDADGDVFNGGDVDYRDDTFTVDTDGDSVNDEVDLDDDNDGILDSVEMGDGTCSPTPSLDWDVQFSLTDDPTTSPGNSFTISNVGFTINRTSNVSSSSTFDISNGTGSGNFYNLLMSATQNSSSRHVFNFDAPIYGLGFTIFDVDQDSGDAIDHIEIIITKQDGTNYTLVSGVDITIPGTITDVGSNAYTANTAGDGGGDLVINSIPEFITQIQILYKNTGTGDLTGTQIVAIGDLSFCTPLDSDGDGVFDFRDLDADNDGIPDNIEAQSTQNYIPPTGNYSLFGIDLAYGTGLTAVNTDEFATAGSDAIPDYLDTDSDGDGLFDLEESGIAGLVDVDMNGVIDAGQTFGLNGLIDSVETGDTDLGYTDINGEYVDPETDGLFSDTDSDVSIGGDLEYRDIVDGVDTDDDGFANDADLDDDGDGIPDTVEANNCLSLSVPGYSAYWPYEQSTDDISNGNNLQTAQPLVAYSTTSIGGDNAISFTGDYFLHYSTDTDFLEKTILDFTYSFWINPSSVTGTQFLIDEGGATNGVSIRLNGSTLEAAVREGGSQQNVDTSSLPTLATGNWYHIALTYNNGDATLYLNNVATPTLSTGFGSLQQHTDNSGFGGSNGDSAYGSTTGNFYTGLMDEVIYYESALSTGLITTLFSNPNCDSDGDGVTDSLDIDSDNDGIPDNVEAQTTLGYVAPTDNTDTNNDGLADLYDPTCTPCGGITGTSLATPYDDDGDATPDYLDTDADGDGIPDIQENGDSDNTVSGVDTDGDGLDDNFEGSDLDDGYDVNDEINTPSSDLPDADSDINDDVTNNDDTDVDFRDAVTGTVTPSPSGALLWLRADLDATTSLWQDQTAENHDATPGTNGPTLNTNAVNFNPAFVFNGGNQYMEIVDAGGDGILETGTSYPNLATYAVILTSEAQNSYALNETTAAPQSDDYTFQVPWGDNNIYYNIENGASNINHPWVSNTTTFDLYNIFGSNNSGNSAIPFQQALYLNGAVVDTDATTNFSTNTISGDDNQPYFIGSQNGSANFHNGQIAEIIVFSGNQSSQVQQSYQSYLAIKYGITLNNLTAIHDDTNITEGDYVLIDGTTKVWDFTANTAHHNDVAGIGRDDGVALAQYQSKSVNSDAIITMGLTEIAANNASNSNYPGVAPFGTGFTGGNKSFLMWGNDNGGLLIGDVSSNTIICAPETTLGRTWKVVESGSIGTVKVGVSKATIDAALPNVVDDGDNVLPLLFKVADDATFTTNVEYKTIDVTTTQNINGVDNYTFDYDFNGTKFFTFSEIEGIFWNGNSAAWSGGNSSGVTGGPSINSSDRNKVMIIDSESSLTHATLMEDVEVECVWVKANSKLTINTDAYLEFDEDFILDGEIRLSGDAQLIQTHTGLSNVQGTGKIYKDQQALVPTIYRYHYWSSPVRETGLDTYRLGEVMFDGEDPTDETSVPQPITWTASLNGADGSGSLPSSYTPITISNHWIYTNLNDPGDGSQWVRQRQIGAIERGQGFSMKSTGVVGQNYTFVGTPNDGSLTFNFGGAGETSLLGNPYPSALDITDFINANTNSIDGTLYFWEHTGEDASSTATEGHIQAGYQGGYSQRNISMGVAANGVAAVESETYDWESNTTQNAASVTQVITEAASSTDVTVTYTVSSGVPNLNTSYSGANGTSGNVLNNTAGLSEYIATFSFDEEIDVSSIYIVNDNPSAGDVLFTLNANNQGTTNNDERTVTLNNDTGNTVNLNWNDITSFTISGPSATNINLVIDNIVWSLGGDISLGNGTYHAPSRYMAVAQGFFVSSSATGGDVRFENSMRTYRSSTAPSEPTFFFRGSQAERDAIDQQEEDLLPIIKLGLGYVNENDYDLHRQIGISFRAANSFNFENGYDSEMFDVGSTDMYWEFEQIPDKKYIIAGVQSISDNLEVPLTIELNSDKPIFLMLDEKENIDIPFYILDKVTGLYHDISNNPMELDLANGVYKDRFFLAFSAPALSLDENDILNTDLNLFVDNSSKEIVIKNLTNTTIKKVELFNILGEKLNTWKSLDSSPENRLKTTNLATGIYIVSIVTEKGKSSKKIVFE